MKHSRLTSFIWIGLLASGPIHAATVAYLGGFEDWTKHGGSDEDYNDIVFSLSGSNLLLSSSGTWNAPPVALGIGGNPFWNNASLDGPGYNIGYCIYGGGNCSTNPFGPDTVPSGGLGPSDSYLTGSSTASSATDVNFTATGMVTLTDFAQVTIASDKIGWYLSATPGTVNYLNPSGTTGVFTFTPGGAFGLVATNGTDTYYSQTVDGNSTDPSSLSHFAFFDPPVDPPAPEPSTMLLAGGALALLGSIKRRRA